MTDKKLFTDQDKSILFEGVDVSDEAKDEFLIKLEAVIADKVSTLKEEFEAEKEQIIAEEKEALAESLEDSINNYLEYVVESWMEENRIALESGIRLELMENFVANMRNVFAENYFDLPEESVDVVNEAEEKARELEEEVARQIEKTAELQAMVEDYQRKEIIAKHSADLTESQVEKLGTLLEGVEFVNGEIFDKKVSTIVESYFGNATKGDDKNEPKKPLNEDADPMAKYLAHL